MVRVTHDHNTMDKVVVGLRTIGLSDELVTDAINALHNEGILFRERAPEGQGEEEVDGQVGPEGNVFEPTEQKEESNLVIHARRELELVGEESKTIEGYCRIIKAFADMGHSGGSASVAIPTINRLLQYKNLKDLTDDPNEWTKHGSDVWPPDGIWQSQRNSEAFSEDGGKTYYFVSEVEDGKKTFYHSVPKGTD